MNFDEANERVREARRPEWQRAPKRKKKRSKRRTISVAGMTYSRLEAYAASQGIAVSGLIEQWIAAALDGETVPRRCPWQGRAGTRGLRRCTHPDQHEGPHSWEAPCES